MLYSGLLITWLLQSFPGARASTWSEWWTYDGISGPDFWGLVNPEWNICSKGKRQSPINIEPTNLLFDPRLSPFKLDAIPTNGYLINTGRDIRFQLDDTNPTYINITGGPLTYQYRLVDVIIHFGSINSIGSEHAIKDITFPVEIQLLGYNSDLYGNLSHALSSTYGLVMIVILAQVNSVSNPEFAKLADTFHKVKYLGNKVPIKNFTIHSLLPYTTDYMTYEGSLTQPGCQETVTWIVINKPIYVSNQQLLALRDLMQGDELNPKVTMENNNRPAQLLNQRAVRTNINFEPETEECTMQRNLFYEAVVRRS